MKVLVINAGSSSLKYQVLDMSDESVIAKGNCERIGMDEGVFSYKAGDAPVIKKTVQMDTHIDAFRVVTDMLVDPEEGVLKSLDEISAIGHRVAQGGSIFKGSTLIDDNVLEGIKSLIPLAPLHNKPEYDGIVACREIFGDEIPECAVFDTSFHATMPPKAYLYAIPYEYYEKYHIRRYGFHGTSHNFVSQRAAELMGKPIEELKIITCHIGNGSSLAAIEGGKVIDTTMGFTPLDGFMMGSRSGSLDPSVITFLMEKENLTPAQMNDILNKRSGLLGISGISSDDRDIEKAYDEGDYRAGLTRQMLPYQIVKAIGSYVAAMNGLDCLVFTAGLGENATDLRMKVMEQVTYFGIVPNQNANEQCRRGKEGIISAPTSKVTVMVIPTNEELVIARDTMALASGK